MAIPSYIFDQLNSQADLVSIIGKHTVLKKAGNEFKGCCPFHGEKTPSFYVNPSKGMYHCFGCGAGGNALKFLQEYENLTFIEAVKELSQQTGIEIPEEDNHKVKYTRHSLAPIAPVQNPVTSQQASPNHLTNNPNYSNNPPNPINSQPQQTNIPSSVSAPITQNHHQNRPVHQANQNLSHHHNHGNSHNHNQYPPQNNLNQGNSQQTHSNFLGVNDTVSNNQSQPPFHQTSTQNSNASATQIVHQAHAQDNEGNLYHLLESIQQFYQNCLKNNQQAYQYFKSRGLTDDTIKTFGLGYAPQGWQHLEAQFPNDIEGLKLLGLVRRSDKGRDYDLLRDRVIFSIRDSQGRVIGFAGRAMSSEVKPKYINSSDSPVFQKQHVLYGYYESRQHRANNWLVVEGYMDVIALYQAGIYGAVASMGTAINEKQISRLLNLNPILTLSFDGDAAGKKASWRTLEVSLPILTDDKELRFLTLPDNHDPDTFIAEHGKLAMQEQMINATPLSAYVYQYLSEQHDLSLPEGKAKLMSDVRTLTNQLPKGSSFRSLLNNDIYQKLSGRQQPQAGQNLLIDFSTKMTLTINLCLCLLYQPRLLSQNPIDIIWQTSGVADIKISDKVMQRINESGDSLPRLPSWHDFDSHDNSDIHHKDTLRQTDIKGIAEFIGIVQSLLPHLPKDANTASHFILASLPNQFQQQISRHWQGFYASLLRDNVIDIEPLFQELLVQQLMHCFKQQQESSANIYVQSVINKRRTQLMQWQKNMNLNAY